jgi:putative membrane protein
MMFHDFGWWGGGWLMLLWMFLFWGGLITLGLWGLRVLFANSSPGLPPSSGRTPFEIAQERYARGDISREEFIKIVQDLKQPDP